MRLYGKRRTAEEIMEDGLKALDKGKKSPLAVCREVLSLDVQVTADSLQRALHKELHAWERSAKDEAATGRVLRAISAAGQLVPICR